MNDKSIFTAALEMKSAAERLAFLDEACKGNTELRAQVERLLKADVAAGSFLDHPPNGIDVEAGTLPDAQKSPGDLDVLAFLSPCDKPDRIGVLDQYEVIEVVGHGGMGTVLRAFDTKLSRVVAVKVMAPELAASPTAVRRFLREATSAAAVVHDHIVTIYAVDDSHRPPFLVMEYIDGQTLQQKIDRQGALELKTILRIGAQAAAGLTAAHKTGLIHRDVKPANILLENGIERVKITDFGLARAADDLEMTKAGMIAGTPQYMSPEQAKGESIDPRSDLFSLGSVLYTMCTGRPAFRAETTMGVLKRVCEDQPRSIHEVNPEIPDWLEAIVAKLLAKCPDDRFQTAAEVAELLNQHLAHEQQPSVHPQPAAIISPQVAEHKRVSQRNQRRWSIAAAVLLLLGAGLSVAETTGVTNVAATVIRIVRGDGTLVVEVDDPNIQVLVDGDEISITGAGPKELRLRPGQHELHTVKDGKAVETKLVTITREGRQVVKVTREQAATAGPTNRIVWDNATDVLCDPSPDGRYLALTDWATGDIAIRELATGKQRLITNQANREPSFAWTMYPKFSYDGKRIAYSLQRSFDDSGKRTWKNELRVVEVDGGGQPKVLLSDLDTSPRPHGWLPDGKAVLTELTGKEQREFALVNAETGAVRSLGVKDLLTPNPHPYISRDGKTIAYGRLSQQGAGYRDIYLIDVASGHETQLTNHSSDEIPIGWSPDGQRLVYVMSHDGGRDAWVVQVTDGRPKGDPQLLRPNLGDYWPLGMTRDGAAFHVVQGGGPSIFTGTLDLAGGTIAATPLAAEKFNPKKAMLIGDWSPDGEFLAYKPVPGSKWIQEVRIVSMKTGEARTIRPDLKLMRRFRWSPDGKSFIAAAQSKSDEGLGVYGIDAQTGKLTTYMPPSKNEVDVPDRAEWSRDGKGFYFNKGRSQLAFWDVAAAMEREIIPADHGLFGAGSILSCFELSPDGNRIAISGRPKGTQSTALYILSSQGETQHELLKFSDGGSIPFVTWMPDGMSLVFVRNGAGEKSGLWSVSVEGGEPRKLEVTGTKERPQMVAIHPDGKQMAFHIAGSRKYEVWVMENFLPPLSGQKAAASVGDSRTNSE